jgi:Ca2+-transporting ATPase
MLLLPLTAAQLLWINILVDGPPALAVSLDRALGVMKRAPRPHDAALLDGPAIRFVLLTGAVKAGVGLAMLLYLPWLGLSTIATRTGVFLYETLAQLAFVYPSRQLSLRRERNPVLNVIVVASVLAQPVIVYLPGMRRLLDLTSLDLLGWCNVVCCVGISWLFADFYSRRVRARSGNGLRYSAAAPPGPHAAVR